MSLRPERDVQKVLISSTCRFTGEFEASGLLVAHAWPSFRQHYAQIRMVEGPAARNAFALVFKTDPADHQGLVIPNYDHVGDMVCSYLSVLYGKRFDNHGALESSGFFNLPDLKQFDSLCDHRLPQNTHKPRVDFCIPLNLTEIKRLMPILFGINLPIGELSAFRSACKFYQQALQTCEQDVEVAYLHLITAGEILSSAVEVNVDRVVDAHTRSVLRRIETELDDGREVARVIRSKLRSVKRRFVIAFDILTDDEFFSRSEAKQWYARLKREAYLKVLGAAYDLRSQYVHTGRSFGSWIDPRSRPDCDEIQHGKPVVDDKDFRRVLCSAPTYVGLERIVRYGLSRFAERFGIDLRPVPPIK